MNITKALTTAYIVVASDKRSAKKTAVGYSARSETRQRSVEFFFYGFCATTGLAILVTLAELSINNAFELISDSRLNAIKLFALCVLLLLFVDRALIWSGATRTTISTGRVISILIICNAAVFGGFYNLGWSSHSAGAALFASLMVCIAYSALLANLSLLVFTAGALLGLWLGQENSAIHPYSVTWSLFTALLMPLTVVALVNIILDRVFESHENALKKSEMAGEALKLQADTDPLTGFFNRNRLQQEFARVLRHVSDHQSAIVAIIDLDNFKAVNTSAGHAAGDAVLRGTAGKIKSKLSDASLIRLGGDEFLALFSADLRVVDVERLFSDLASAAPTEYLNEEIWLSLSVGYTIIHDNMTALSTATGEADLALRQAKRSGKGQAVMYSRGASMPIATDAPVSATFNPLLRGREIREAIPVRNVGSAILSEQIDFAIQPIFDASSDTLVAAEGLLRWTLPDGSIVPIKDYVAAFTALEFQSPYFRFIYKKRMSLLRTIRAIKPIDVHFNFTIDALGIHETSNDVSDLVENFADSFHGLVIEITEKRFNRLNANTAISPLSKPNYDWAMQHGAKLALDDFGMGDNNLDRLASYPVDIVKLDRSWIAAMSADKKYWALTSKTRELCEELGISVIAEGVETPQQESTLIDLGISLHQGFLRGAPMSKRAFMDFLKESNG